MIVSVMSQCLLNSRQNISGRIKWNPKRDCEVQVSVSERKDLSPIPIPKLDLGFSSRYRNRISVSHYLSMQSCFLFWNCFIDVSCPKCQNKHSSLNKSPTLDFHSSVEWARLSRSNLCNCVGRIKVPPNHFRYFVRRLGNSKQKLFLNCLPVIGSIWLM